VPKEGYRSLTIKQDVYEKFIKAVQESKEKDPKIDNSKFMDSFLDKHKKSK